MSIPQHLGFIIDGNRRWAKAHDVSVAEGHRQGYLNLKSITAAAMRRGVRYVSAYVFSSENWKRDRQEIRDLMKLLGWVLRHESEQFHKEGIRIRIVGSRLRLGAALVRAILHAEELTKDNTRGTLLLCLDYGGQREIVEAVKRIAESGIDAMDITPELITHHLYAPDVPEPDLIVRTSGEQRLSNFLLWGSAYSKLAFPKVYWPDFSEEDLGMILDDYASRRRRFGK
jgi:undecaprenyl diphosphate synthase